MLRAPIPIDPGAGPTRQLLIFFYVPAFGVIDTTPFGVPA